MITKHSVNPDIIVELGGVRYIARQHRVENAYYLYDIPTGSILILSAYKDKCKTIETPSETLGELHIRSTKCQSLK